MFSPRFWLRAKSKRASRPQVTQPDVLCETPPSHDHNDRQGDDLRFLAELRHLRGSAETRLAPEYRAQIIAGLDAVIEELAALVCQKTDQAKDDGETEAAYCGLKLNVTISPGPSRCEASSVAAQAARLVQSLSQPEDGKTDEAAGKIATDQPVMSVSKGPNCQIAAADTAAEAVDILKALQRQEQSR